MNDLIKIALSMSIVVILLALYNLSKNNEKFYKPFAFLGIMCSTVYILWRVIFTLPFGNIGIIFGIILLFFEAIAFIQSVIFRKLFSMNKKICVNIDSKFQEFPTVDVFVSTYNESKDIIKRTLVSVVNIDYPKDKLNIYVGDDGRREEIKQLAEELGINYVTRENNLHAKAGNINNMLGVSKGEFILFLDADMIPHKKIIKRMIYFFESSKTGFVQAPQVFYNYDPYQFNMYMGSKIPNEQDFFMRLIQQKRAMNNVVLHIGTNAIFRREAITAIGGIPTGSITEDMATGMLIQNAGYNSYYVNEVLALGLSPESLPDMVKQRDRWCRGTIQVYKKYKPMKMKGLSLWQRMLYMDGFMYWMFGLNKLVYILSPLIFLFFKIPLFQARGLDLLLIFLPHFLSVILFFKAVSGGTRNILWSHIYETSLAPHIAKSFILEFFFRKKPKFNVTPKGVTTDKSFFRFKLAYPHMFLMLASLTAIIINYRIVQLELGSEAFTSVAINFVWSMYNGLAIFLSLFLFMDRRRYRLTERIPIDFKVRAVFSSINDSEDVYCAIVEDISEKGAGLRLINDGREVNYAEGNEIDIAIENVGNIKGIIKRVSRRKNSVSLGVSFIDIGIDEFYNINQYRFDLHNKYMNMPQLEEDADGAHNILINQFKRNKLKD